MTITKLEGNFEENNITEREEYLLGKINELENSLDEAFDENEKLTLDNVKLREQIEKLERK